MAVCNVTEYAGSAMNSSGPIQVPAGPKLASYDITLSGTSAVGQTFNAATRLVRISVDSNARVTMGPASGLTANATGDARFAANQTEYWGVPNSGLAIAAINSAS